METTIADLAHSMHEVTQWAPDSEAPTEDHLDQIIQAALSVQKTCVSSKGYNIWVPHRQGLHKEFCEEVLKKNVLLIRYRIRRLSYVFGIFIHSRCNR